MQSSGEMPYNREDRLVLGFDAGCTTCGELARTMEEQLGDKLEVRNLHDPQVEHWRKQVLGANAPWTPTLIEVKGAGVKAWTGVRMGVALSCRLGPAATWRVMKVLGNVHGAARPADAAAFKISRERFLKGVGGAVVVLGVLTGTSSFASMVSARSTSQNGALDALKPIKTTNLTGKELFDAARRAAQRRDVVNLMGRTWSAQMRYGRSSTAFEDGEQKIQIHDVTPPGAVGRTTSKADRIAVKAARHELKNGATLLAVAYKLLRESKVLVYYESDRPIPDGESEFESQATLYRIENDDAVFEGVSVDGGREVPEGSNTASTRVTCGGCSRSNCTSRRRYCKRIKWGCLTVACAACIPACGSLLGCLYCAAVQCPYAYFVACCKRVGYRCVACRYCG